MESLSALREDGVPERTRAKGEREMNDCVNVEQFFTLLLPIHKKWVTLAASHV